MSPEGSGAAWWVDVGAALTARRPFSQPEKWGKLPHVFPLFRGGMNIHSVFAQRVTS
jgi:hypothetical protein